MSRHRVAVPDPTLRRLCAIRARLVDLAGRGVGHVTSQDLAHGLRVSAAAVRRDIGALGVLGPSPAGYPIADLRRLIDESTGLDRAMRLCVVGLDGLGEALVSAPPEYLGGHRILAAFDPRTNRLETVRSPVALFPTYEIEAVVRREGIEAAVVASLPKGAEDVVARLARGGIRGVLNLSGIPLGEAAAGLVCTDVSVANELCCLSARLRTKEERR